MQLILYLNGERMDVYRATHKQVSRIARFPSDPAGQAAFAAFIDREPATPCRILTDLIEEEFRQEHLPHVRGRDKRELHARHAARLFRATPFRHSRVLGREASGRRDDRVLFSALTNPELLEPWVRVLQAREQPLFGIHSMPIVSRRLAAALGANRGHALLITLQDGDRLRQTFLHDGQVTFSRLSPLAAPNDAGFGFSVKAEAEKTLRYLTTLKLLPFEERLPLHIVCDGAQLDAFNRAGEFGDYFDARVHRLSEVAGRFGIEAYPDGSYSDLLLVALLDRKRVRNHYAEDQHRRLAVLHRTKSFIHKAGLGIVGAAAVVSAINVIDASVLETRQQALSAAIVETQTALDKIKRLQQQVAAEPKDVLAAVEIADRIDARRLRPRALLAGLGSVLKRAPDMVLDKLTWASAPEESERTNAALPVTVTLEGHLRDFDGSLLHATRRLSRLATLLGQLPGVEHAEVVKQPVNTAPDASLNGRINLPTDEQRADFVVQLTYGGRHG